MGKKSGVIVRLPDERLAIIYDTQPLKGKIIATLVDEKYKPLLTPAGKHQTLLRNTTDSVNYKIIGYVD